VKPYGSWKSRISSDDIVRQSKRLSEVIVQEDGTVYWLEGRANSAGRNILVKTLNPLDVSTVNSQEKLTSDVTKSPYNVRTMVHEYGGGAYVVGEGICFFSHLLDHCIYGILTEYDSKDGAPEPLRVTDPLPEGQKQRRFADLVIDQDRGRLICICEEHDLQAGGLPTNSLVAVSIETGEVTTLHTGNDFYSSPRISPNGQKLAYLSWDLPKMPWEGTRLWVTSFGESGGLKLRSYVAGGEAASIVEPQWSPDGYLYFCNDKSGWWNLYRYDCASGDVMNACEMEAEFSRPHWTFGNRHYGFGMDGQVVAAYRQSGSWSIGILDQHRKVMEKIETPYTSISWVSVKGNYVAFLGASPHEPQTVVRMSLESKLTTVIQKSSEEALPPEFISVPRLLTYPLNDGHHGYAWYYPPMNPEMEPMEGQLPPMIVEMHGGPTACSEATLNMKTQFWTSRGFAFLDVNYRGSTGFGRWYWYQLKERWGQVDIEDATLATLHAVSLGLADMKKLIIHGGSAGGYTTLAALAFKDVFSAGASHYGVSDLEMLARDTHKFESGYLEWLIGPYPKEEALYKERSPINYVDQLSCPIIFFHGLEDKVVPINQAEMMVEALEKKGIPVSFVPFEGEGHGFRYPSNIKKSLDMELYFYSQVFGFDLPDKVETVPIVNLNTESGHQLSKPTESNQSGMWCT